MEMRKQDEYPIIRSSSHDVNWLMILSAICSSLDSLGRELDRRIAATDNEEMLHVALHATEVMRDQILMTFPPEKRDSIQRQFGHLFVDCKTYVPIGYKSKAETVMAVDHLDTLIRYAHTMNCQICSHPTWCNKRCGLGRALDACCPEHRDRKESWQDIDVTLEGQ